jgi:Uma2 family endonuclease
MGPVTTLPRGQAFTRADLASMPDDGRRYELIDGALVVTPAPSLRHQTVVVNLLVVLQRVCPPDLQVLVAPFDVALTPHSVLQPDVLVARRTDFTPDDLPVPPLLAVEVLSPSSRRIDLTLKKSRYEAAGCPSYWVIDPDEPGLTAWELRDGSYVEVARAAADDVVSVASPYVVTFSPGQLVT